MMSTFRMIAMGAGLTTATGVAVVTLPSQDNAAGREIAPADAGYEICLKPSMRFFEDESGRCFTQAQLRALRDRPLVNDAGEPVMIRMTHPSDAAAAPAECHTCRDYSEASFSGFYAANSREMRREGFFQRACGVLAALGNAQPAVRNYFTDGSPTAAEVAVFGAAFEFGEAAANAAPEQIQVEKPGDYRWRVVNAHQTVMISELANADFDGDGIEEILVFIAQSPTGGSASAYAVGLLEKDAGSEAELKFTPQRFERAEAAGVGG